MGLNARHLFYGILGLALCASAPLFAQNASPSAAKSEKALNGKKGGLKDQIADILQACFQCHGPGAVSQTPTRPTLAGQKADYLGRQLKAFQAAANPETPAHKNANGSSDEVLMKRTDPVMEHMVAGIAPNLIRPLARALSNLSCDGGAPQPSRETTIAYPPSAQACTACHGVNGISPQSQVPNLAGQQRAYLRRQLLLIRETAWGAQPLEGEAWRSHPIMEAQAARIPIADIDAIARYYSELDCRGGG